jgi:hypothetical protein
MSYRHSEASAQRIDSAVEEYASGTSLRQAAITAGSDYRTIAKRIEARGIPLRETLNSQPRSGVTDNCRPRHSRKFAQFSREWFEACDRAFRNAMKEYQADRPTGYMGLPKVESS